MKKPAIGRSYQHIEDLVLTHGSHGALHALERLEYIAANPNTLELKWDGNPVLYWGRNSKGQFSLLTKNAWDYLKRGKNTLDNEVNVLPFDKKELKNFILSTGVANDTRTEFADAISNLWDLFEAASLAEGYIEGSLLFYPSAPACQVLDEYRFTPNITTFRVRCDTALGKQITNATAMVAATGMYKTAGSSDELRGSMPASTADLVIKGTTTIPNGTIELTTIGDTREFITAHAAEIDEFLSPKPSMKYPGRVVYEFLNSVLRSDHVLEQFKEWASETLSAKQHKIMLDNVFMLVPVLLTIARLVSVKHELIAKCELLASDDITQEKAEGFVHAYQGTYQHDIPGQFVKLINQENWAPRK